MEMNRAEARAAGPFEALGISGWGRCYYRNAANANRTILLRHAGPPTADACGRDILIHIGRTIDAEET